MKASGRSEIFCDCVDQTARPPTTIIVASVTMNGGIPSRVTATPLTSPTAAPTASIAATAAGTASGLPGEVAPVGRHDRRPAATLASAIDRRDREVDPPGDQHDRLPDRHDQQRQHVRGRGCQVPPARRTRARTARTARTCSATHRASTSVLGEQQARRQGRRRPGRRRHRVVGVSLDRAAARSLRPRRWRPTSAAPSPSRLPWWITNPGSRMIGGHVLAGHQVEHGLDRSARSRSTTSCTPSASR